MRDSTESPIGTASSTVALILRAVSRVASTGPADSAGKTCESSQAALEGSSRKPVLALSDSQCSGRACGMGPSH
jgi:hypothetical protein